MKHARLVHLLAAMLVVLVSISGCGPSTTRTAANYLPRIRNAAKLAAQSAAEARTAQRLASGLSDGAELRALMNQADDAALRARGYANEAASLQRQLDNNGARQVADDVIAAVQAAEEAAAASRSIPLLFRRVMIHSSVDDAMGRIVPKVRFNGDADEQQFLRDLLDEIVAASFCDLLVDTVASGELPTQAGVQDAVAENALDSGVNFSGIYEVISKELIDVYYQFASGEQLDELEEYKEACQNALTER
jgi:hypothetical protein